MGGHFILSKSIPIKLKGGKDYFVSSSLFVLSINVRVLLHLGGVYGINAQSIEREENMFG